MNPWAIYKKGELWYIGMHKDEADCWRVALGWPTVGEVKQAIDDGALCLPVRVVPLTKEQTK